MGSLGSSEQLSDSEQDEAGQRPRCLMKQESEVSMDDDQLSYRDSLDLSLSTHTDLEQDGEQDPDNLKAGGPPALPDTGLPDDDSEQEVTTSLAELSINQSNNNNNNDNDKAYSPALNLSELPLTCLCGKNLPLTRNRDMDPEFV